MSQTTFASILDAPATDSVRPPAMPAGSYLAMVKGLPRRDKSSKKGTDFIEYTLAFITALQGEDGPLDVDPQALEEFGEVQGKEMKLTFYMTENSAYRHREFCENDLQMDCEGKSHWELAQEAPGHQVVVHVRQKPREDGKGLFSEIASTAPVED